tara:strand:- start:221 stop:328 length:108 start_codon:yes stop_codon:yes gene_type:complete
MKKKKEKIKKMKEKKKNLSRKRKVSTTPMATRSLR